MVNKNTITRLLTIDWDQPMARSQAGMSLAGMVVTIGLFSILMAGLASFVSFMGQSQKKIHDQVTHLALQQHLTTFLTSTHAWRNSKAAVQNQTSFACLVNRAVACQGTRTADQSYYRFSLFDSAATNSQPLFPGSPSGLGGFTRDGQTCVHSNRDLQDQKSDLCPYFVEIGWKFHCDLPCLTDSVELIANLKYSPRSQLGASINSSPVAVSTTFREPQLLNSQLATLNGGEIVKFENSYFGVCRFTTQIVSVPLVIKDPTTVLVRGYGRSHLTGGSYSSILTNNGITEITPSSSLKIYLDPGCANCADPAKIPSVYEQPKPKEVVGDISVFFSERGREHFKHCPDSSCRVNYSIDPSGVFYLEPGPHTIYAKHSFWHCEDLDFYGEIDLTQLNISFIY